MCASGTSFRYRHPVLNTFLEKVFAIGLKCLRHIAEQNGSRRSYIHIEANVTEDGRECRIAVLTSLNVGSGRGTPGAELHYSFSMKLFSKEYISGCRRKDYLDEQSCVRFSVGIKRCLGHTSESTETLTPCRRLVLPGCDHHPWCIRTGKELRMW